MSDRLNAILEKLSSLPQLESFGDTIEAIRAAYEVNHISYAAMSLGLEARSRPDRHVAGLPEVDGVLLATGRRVAAMSYSAEWLNRYLEKFYHLDPVVLGASTSFDPIDWADLDWSDSDRHGFREEATAFGVGNQGYTIPVRGPAGQFALFTINKTCSPQEWKTLLKEHRTDFMLLAHFAHQRVLELAGHEDASPTRPLSARERDALRMVAAGFSRGQAAEKLGISENTFRVYIDSARYKLCALNVPHAIALAAHKGIIPPT